MKRFLLLLILLSSQLPAAQAPDTLWTRTYGGNNRDVGCCVQGTFDSGYIVLGWTGSFGPLNAWLLKIDQDGDTLWTKTCGWNDGTDEGCYIQQTRDSGYIITGGSYSSNRDAFLIKTDKNGDTLWRRLYDYSGSDENYCVQETSDSGFISAGHNMSMGYISMWLIKTDYNGDTLWTRTFSDTGFAGTGCWVQETSDSNYIVAGLRWGNFTNENLLIKINKEGNVLWEKTYNNGCDLGTNCSVQETFDKGYIFVGETFVSPDYGILLMKTDSVGDSLFTKTFRINGFTYFSSMQQTSDSGYIILGGDSTGGVLLIKTDQNGNMLWHQTYCGKYFRGEFIRETSAEDYIVAGTYLSSYEDVWLLKIAKETAVEESSPNSLSEAKSALGGPNPFINSTLINYDLPFTNYHLQGSVYDVSGQLVDVIRVNQCLNQCKSVAIGKDLKPGIYFVKLGDSKPIKIIKIGGLK